MVLGILDLFGGLLLGGVSVFSVFCGFVVIFGLIRFFVAAAPHGGSKDE